MSPRTLVNAWSTLQAILKRFKPSIHPSGTVFSLATSGMLVLAGVLLSQFMPTWAVLPSEDDKGGSVISVILQAQGAIMAISLAVLAFLVGSLIRRQDLDDPLYAWFLRKAYVRPAFALTATLVLGTGAVYFFSALGIGESQPNHVLFAGGSFGVSVLLIIGFAFWTVRLLHPGRYREYKREVTLQQVTLAAREYSKHAMKASFEDFQTRNWRTANDVDADQALERITDDAEQAIRDARFVDYRRALETYQACISAATNIGCPAIEDLPWLINKSDLRDWPLRRPLRHGFYRLRATAFRERRFDYANLVHQQCEQWLRDGTIAGHVLVVDLATSSLADEYWLARRTLSTTEPELPEIIAETMNVAFRHLRAVAGDDQLKVSDRFRYEVSIDLICHLHDWAGETLEQGDLESLRLWLNSMRSYLAILKLNSEQNRLGTLEPIRLPSLMAHARIALAAIAGRALQLGDQAALEIIVQETDFGFPPAFPAEGTSGEMSWLSQPLVFGSLEGAWKQWLKRDYAGKSPATAKTSHYALSWYLWLGFREKSIRERPSLDSSAASELRNLYLRSGEHIGRLAVSKDTLRHERHIAVAKWLDWDVLVEALSSQPDSRAQQATSEDVEATTAAEPA